MVAAARGLSHRPVAFFLVFALLYGFNATDFDDFSRMTRDPFQTHPDVGRQFLHSSPLTLFLGWPLTRLFGAEVSYWTVCAVGLALMSGAGWLYLRGRPGPERRTIGLVCLSTPLLLVLCRWLGKSDPYLIACYLGLLACRGRAWAAAGLACLLIFTHREIGLLMLVCDALLRRRLTLPVVLGASAGFALVSLYQFNLSTPPFSRVDLAIAFLKSGLLGWIRVPVAHLVLGLGWFWLVIFVRGWTSDWPWVAAAIVLCFGVVMDAADFTRVLILSATPLVAYTAEAVAASGEMAAFLARSPFPLPFLVQLQLESFDQVSDSQWPMTLAGTVSRLLHHGF